MYYFMFFKNVGKTYKIISLMPDCLSRPWNGVGNFKL